MLKITIVATAVLFVSEAAAAEEQSTSTQTTSTSKEAGAGDNPFQGERKGFEIMLRPGYGSAGDKSPVRYKRAPLLINNDPGQIYNGEATPYGGGFAGDLSLGYRFISYVSVGLYGEYRTSSASDVNDGTSDPARSAWGAGLYVRGYLPMIHERFDPWLQLGIGYAQDSQTYKRPVGGRSVDWSLKHHGVVVPLALGADFRVLPMLAIGPSFRYAIVSGAGACWKVEASTALGTVDNSQCSDAAEAKRVTHSESYGAWSLGLDLRLTLF